MYKILLYLLIICPIIFGQTSNFAELSKFKSKISGKRIPTLKKIKKEFSCPNTHRNKEFWDTLRMLPVEIIAVYPEQFAVEWKYSEKLSDFLLVNGNSLIKVSKIKIGTYLMVYCDEHKILYTLNNMADDMKKKLKAVTRMFWKDIRILPVEITSIDLENNLVFWTYKDRFTVEVRSFQIPKNFRVQYNEEFIPINEIKAGKYLATFYKDDWTLYGLSDM